MGFLNSWHIHLVASVRSLQQGQYPPVRLSPFLMVLKSPDRD